MKILLLAAALFSALSAAPASPGEKTDLQELFRSLDRVIARSGEYTARRESRIDSLKRALTRDGLSLRERFDLTERLAENYNSYQSDFALLYLRQTPLGTECPATLKTQTTTYDEKILHQALQPDLRLRRLGPIARGGVQRG